MGIRALPPRSDIPLFPFVVCCSRCGQRYEIEFVYDLAVGIKRATRENGKLRLKLEGGRDIDGSYSDTLGLYLWCFVCKSEQDVNFESVNYMGEETYKKSQALRAQYTYLSLNLDAEQAP